MASGSGASFKALAGLGEQVSDIGFKFAEKLNREESNAQIAQYYADRKIRANAFQGTLSSMQDPEEISSAYERWQESEDELFASTKLRDDARGVIQNNNEGFYADMQIGAKDTYNKARIGVMDNTYVDLQNLGIDGETHTLEDGTVLSGDDLHQYALQKRVQLGTIDHEFAQKQIRTMPSKRSYRTNLNDLEILKGLNLSGEMSDEQYLDALEEKRVSVSGDKELMDEHSGPLDTMIRARQNNLRGKTVKKMTKTSDDIFEKLAGDDMDESDIAQLYNDNPTMASALDASLVTKLKEAKVAGNKDAIDALEALEQMVNGEESWSGSVRRIGDLNSSYGVLALFAANSYAKDIVSTQDSLSSYEALWSRFKDYKISVDADTKDYIHTMSYYMKRKSGGHGDFLNKKLRDFAEWQKAPDGKTYAEFRVEQFGEDAKMDVMQTVALLQGLPSVTTQEEYDALPLGAIYLEDGVQYRKQ